MNLITEKKSDIISKITDRMEKNMALDKEYFDSINLEIAKKKYYNANKVEAVLADIRTRALELQLENENLKSRLSGSQKDSAAEAERRAQEIVRQAEQKAAAILAAAESRAARIESGDGESRRRAVLERIRSLQLQIVDELDDELDSLQSEEATVPADIADKLGAIAGTLFSIGNDE